MTCYGHRSQWPRFPETAADIALTRAPAPGSLGGSRGFVSWDGFGAGPLGVQRPGSSLAFPRISRLSWASASLFLTYLEQGYFVQAPRDLVVTVETAVLPK